MTGKFDINKYIEIKRKVQKHFQDKKLGEQSLYEDQSRLFKPLIDTTRESSNQLQNKIDSKENTLINTLTAIATNLQQRIDQLENLQALRYYATEVEAREREPDTRILDFDNDFTDVDRNNLEKLKLDLPSTVYRNKNPIELLDKLKTINSSIGQKKRYNKITEEEYISLKATNSKYRDRLNQIIGGQKIPAKSGTGIKNKKLVKPIRVRGRPKTVPDIISYNSPDDLVKKLDDYIKAYEAGNNGAYNYIVEMLDELLKIKIMNKIEYNQIFKNIFPDSIK